MARTLYDILGVYPEAETGEIKKAYRSKAQRLHPDKEEGDEGAFKELVAAYEVLMDETRRKYYDETGEVPEPQQSPFIQEAIAVLLHLIDRIEDVKTTNMLQAAGEVVSAAVQKARHAKAVVTEQISDRKEVAARLSCKEGENTLRQAVLDNISLKEKELAQVTKLEEEGKRILDYLNGYSYKVDAHRPTRPFWSTTTITSAFTGGINANY